MREGKEGGREGNGEGKEGGRGGREGGREEGGVCYIDIAAPTYLTSEHPFVI